MNPYEQTAESLADAFELWILEDRAARMDVKDAWAALREGFKVPKGLEPSAAQAGFAFAFAKRRIREAMP